MDETTHHLGDLRVMAPHVEPSWTEAFVVEQRLLGVAGERIGDALVTVESHVVESRQSALQAFGDPREYAREVATPAARGVAGVDRETVVGSVLGLVAIVVVPRALGAAVRGSDVAVTVGDLVVTGLLGALCAGLFLASTAVLRLLVDHRWASVVGVLLVVAASVLALTLLPTVVSSVPVGVVAVVGLVAMVAEVVILWRVPSDPVLAPGSSPDARGGSPLNALALGPGLVGVMCLLTWATHLAS